MHESPLVSIIVPCYNQVEYLDDSLGSILKQTYSNWECIVVNDGSTDNINEKVVKWLEVDTRIKYYIKENEGLSMARNTGIHLANGEYILPLDADDYISADYLFLAVQEFQKNNAIKVVYANAEKFGIVSGKWLLPEYSLLTLCRKNMIYCSAFFKKKDWESVGGYDAKMLYGLEDWEFWISILKKGGEVSKIERTCFYYRVKEKSMVTAIDKRKRKYSHDYLCVKHSDLFVKMLGSNIALDKENTVLKKQIVKLKSIFFFKVYYKLNKILRHG